MQHRRLRPDTRATAALEFAIVSIPFIGLVLGIAVVSFNFYVQFILDLSLRSAIRQVQLGLVPPGYSAADFTGRVFCPIFGRFLACNSLVVTIQPVADYQNDGVVVPPTAQQLATAAKFCTGQPGQLMFARIVYLAPAVSQFWPYAQQVHIGGADVTAITSTAAFANENPLGSPIPASGGC